MSWTLNDFDYHFKFGQRLRRISCKHCGKDIKFKLPKNGFLQDVQIHAAHNCVAHTFETPAVSNVGTYFSRFKSKDGNMVVLNERSRWSALKSLTKKLRKL